MQSHKSFDPPVSQVMRRSSLAVSTEDSIDNVAAHLERHRLFVAPVLDADGRMFGVISSFAVAHLLTNYTNPKAIRAWELCAYKPVSVSPETPLSVVANLMVKKRLQYVVVTDGSKLAGIVSSFDFVEHYTRLLDAKAA